MLGGEYSLLLLKHMFKVHSGQLLKFFSSVSYYIAKIHFVCISFIHDRIFISYNTLFPFEDFSAFSVCFHSSTDSKVIASLCVTHFIINPWYRLAKPDHFITAEIFARLNLFIITPRAVGNSRIFSDDAP